MDLIDSIIVPFVRKNIKEEYNDVWYKYWSYYNTTLYSVITQLQNKTEGDIDININISPTIERLYKQERSKREI
jgi:hypothetical protein